MTVTLIRFFCLKNSTPGEHNRAVQMNSFSLVFSEWVIWQIMFSHFEDPFSLCTVTLGHCLLFESKNKHMQVTLKQWTIFSIAINICIAPWSQKTSTFRNKFAEYCCKDYFILPKMVSSSCKEEQKKEKAATKVLELPGFLVSLIFTRSGKTYPTPAKEWWR